jgi:UBA-like domain
MSASEDVADSSSYLAVENAYVEKQLAIAADHERKTNEMMREISQEKAVCEFYLESTNWDMDDAISMFKNMTDNL